MVAAILEGRKTQTRRAVKTRSYITGIEDGIIFEMTEDDSKPINCPYGQPGDRLWVRETWAHEYGGGFLYRASHSHMKPYGNWKPSIHMPRIASRINLEVKSIRVERLHDISEKDAQAEGASDFLAKHDLLLFSELDPIIPRPFAPYQFGFMKIWLKINGVESWNANPWAWVVEFKTPAND